MREIRTSGLKRGAGLRPVPTLRETMLMETGDLVRGLLS